MTEETARKVFEQRYRDQVRTFDDHVPSFHRDAFGYYEARSLNEPFKFFLMGYRAAFQPTSADEWEDRICAALEDSLGPDWTCRDGARAVAALQQGGGDHG